ncbi:MAG: aldo/keto reductase, partial [Oscillospiraceae bacterium]|nr:aldo/keto reductase [Oscillospiraceae bacterium]
TMPSVNQVEFNPFSQQKELRAIMDKNNVKLECWYPLGHGNSELLNNSVITALAEKYGKNPGQIILRFEVQEGFVTLPKSINPDRIKGNIDIFDFSLTDREMDSIRALDTGKTSHDPETPGMGESLLNAFVVED